MSLDLFANALEITANDPAGLDLTDPGHLERTLAVAEKLMATSADTETLRRLESDLIEAERKVPLVLHVAVKLAISRRIVLGLKGPAHLSVVFAVYKEHQRILPAEKARGGEDFLVRKVRQLEWLFAGCEDLTWDLIVVDDGCPEGSGRIAQTIVDAADWSDRVRVLYLAEAIAENCPVTIPLATPDDSRKGGSIALGMWTAAQDTRANHVIAFTDADLSTHLGLCGLLMGEILVGGCDAAIGSRREPHSVVIKQGVRNMRGKLFIYLWKRLIGLLPDLVDTQCGFKAFGADTVRAIVPDLLEKKFAFDIELLMKTRLRRADSIARVPVAWIDSEALSTTTEIQPYLPMLKAIVKMYRTYLPAEKKAEKFASFIEALDEAGWDRLVENIPAEITKREPAEFGGFSDVSADQLRRAAGL